MSTPGPDIDPVRRLLDPDADLDILFGQHAVARGYVTQARLDERLEEQRRLAAEGRPERIGRLLMRHGDLTVEQCREILEAQGAPPDREPPGLGPGGRIGRYRVIRVVGSGGMGIVYEAFDEDLRRRVALKVLRGTMTTPAVLERFRREAATAAALRHPNIVAVHEVGTGRDPSGEETHYICMDFVEGRTLSDVIRAGDVPLSRRVEMIEKIARAVHHAHQAGIVHRDIKPGNIMVAADGEPILGDFGLARNFREPDQLTRTGTAIGTPIYMAPEQVRGRSGEIDGRTDVYGLAVTLYETATRRPPFVARTAAELYRLIAEEEPPAPRSLSPAVDGDLQTIILKGMEKDRRRRYADAQALADDLRRHRQQEPILARPASVAHRVRRAIARRRGVLATAAASLAVIALLLLVLLPRLREVHGRNLELMREIAESNLAFALEIRRVGNLAGMRTYAAKVEEACRRVMAEAPERAEPHYYLGRMHRALLRNEDALAEQDRALRKHPGFAPARYERGLLRAQRYDESIARLHRQWRRRRAERIAGRPGQVAPAEPHRSELEDAEAARWRAGAEEDLAAAGTAAARAILAWLRKEGGAATLLERAAEEPADEAELCEWRGRLAREAGDFETAVTWYTRGIERDQGYLPLLRALIEVRLEQARRAPDPEPLFAKALEDCNRLLKLAGDDADALLARSEIFIDRGNHALRTGGDAGRDYLSALDDLGRARTARPGSPEILLCEGGAHLNLAEHRSNRGEEAEAALQPAVAAFREALALDPRNAEIWLTLGVALSNLGNSVMQRGADPVPSFAEAQDCDRRAIELRPENAEAWASRGTLRFNWAHMQLSRNEDPTDLLRGAVDDFNEAIRLRGGEAGYYSDRGWAHGLLALHRGRAGSDVDEAYREALRDLDRAIEIDPRDFEAFRRRGAIWTNWGNHRAHRGVDAAELYEKAVRDFDRSLELNRRKADTWSLRGGAVGAWMRHLASRPQHDRERVRALYEELKKDFAEALKINPLSAETYARRGTFHYMMQSWREALDDFNKALELNPSLEAQLGRMRDTCRQRLGE